MFSHGGEASIASALRRRAGIRTLGCPSVHEDTPRGRGACVVKLAPCTRQVDVAGGAAKLASCGAKYRDPQSVSAVLLARSPQTAAVLAHLLNFGAGERSIEDRATAVLRYTAHEARPGSGEILVNSDGFSGGRGLAADGAVATTYDAEISQPPRRASQPSESRAQESSSVGMVLTASVMAVDCASVQEDTPSDRRGWAVNTSSNLPLRRADRDQ